MPVSIDDVTGSPTVASLEKEDLFPIREVSRLTGVNPVTLRAWERRYGLIQPTRTESGHRLYALADIERVHSILGWLDRGVAVSKVGKILAKAAPLQALSHIIPNELVQADYAQWQQQVHAAVSAFDDIELDRVYGQIFSSYVLPVVFQDILMPLWRALLQRQDAFGVAQALGDPQLARAVGQAMGAGSSMPRSRRTAASFSPILPLWLMPVRSPLTSAMKTGTPRREKFTARVCKVTVLPVPVAPVMRPWRLARPGSR